MCLKQARGGLGTELEQGAVAAQAAQISGWIGRYTDLALLSAFQRGLCVYLFSTQFKHSNAKSTLIRLVMLMDIFSLVYTFLFFFFFQEKLIGIFFFFFTSNMISSRCADRPLCLGENLTNNC